MNISIVVEVSSHLSAVICRPWPRNPESDFAAICPTDQIRQDSFGWSASGWCLTLPLTDAGAERLMEFVSSHPRRDEYIRPEPLSADEKVILERNFENYLHQLAEEASW